MLLTGQFRVCLGTEGEKVPEMTKTVNLQSAVLCGPHLAQAQLSAHTQGLWGLNSVMLNPSAPLTSQKQKSLFPDVTPEFSDPGLSHPYLEFPKVEIIQNPVSKLEEVFTPPSPHF